MSNINNKGGIYVISAPSGTGKTTLVDLLKKADANIVESVSHTTRAMREGEINGVSYHFVTKDVFKQMLANDAFVESFEVFGNLYGTSKQELESITSAGKNAVLILDTKGALFLKDLYGSHVTTIFVNPPSIDTLEQRLVSRSTDSREVIEKRLSEATSEMAQAYLFDHQILNDDINTALASLLAVIYRQGR